MSMLAITQSASAPNASSVWPGIKGQADKPEFQVKDHAPPGPEPPPPDQVAKGEEAASAKQNASSRKPDSLPKAETAQAQPVAEADHDAPVADQTGQETPPNAPGPPHAGDPATAMAAIGLSIAPGFFALEPSGGVPADLAKGLAGPSPMAEPQDAPALILGPRQHKPTASEAPGIMEPGILPSSVGAEARALPGQEGQIVADPAGLQKGTSQIGAPSEPDQGSATEALAADAVLQKLRPGHAEPRSDTLVSDAAALREPHPSKAEGGPVPGDCGPFAVETDSASAEARGGTADMGGSDSEQQGSQTLDAEPIVGDGEKAQEAMQLQAAALVEHPAASPSRGVAGISNETALQPAETRRALEQIADRIEMLAAIRPKEGVTVRLDPEHLGSITIKVMGTSKEISAELTASNDSVRAALQQHSSDLTQSLGARGVHLQSVQVGSETAAPLGGRQQGASQNFDQAQTAQFHHGFRREATADGFTLEQARGYARRATGVDVWV